jgi:hypothetical protein
MRKYIKLLDGLGRIKKEPRGAARMSVTLPSRDLRQFMAPGTNVKQEVSMSDSTTTTSSSGSVASRKRPKIITLSDEEDEDEIRQNTRVVDGAAGKKKAKVAVVIKK